MKHLYEASMTAISLDDLPNDDEVHHMHVVCADPNMLISSILKSHGATELRRESLIGDVIRVEIKYTPHGLFADTTRTLIISPVDFITEENEVI